MDLVSIIVPVYNAEAYLSDCLDSIINQTYKNIEIILVDDGSSDDSGRICDEYAKRDNRITVIHKDNGGVSSARNMGIDVCNGKFICFVDSDDIVEETYVENFIDTINLENVDLVVCNIRDIYPNRISERRNISGVLYGQFYLDYHKLIGLLRVSVIKLYKADIIKNNDLRFSEDVIAAEDQIFNFQYYKYVSKYAYNDKSLYHYYHRNNGGLSVGKTKDFYQAEIVKLKHEREFLYLNKVYRSSKVLNNHALACIKRFIIIKNEENNYFTFRKRVLEIRSLMDLKNITILNLLRHKIEDYSFMRSICLLLIKYKLIYFVWCYFNFHNAKNNSCFIEG